MLANRQETKMLAHEIADYFEQYPNAADSLEGISKWWLGQRGYLCTEQQVFDALQYLCSIGSVVQKRNTAGSVVYFNGRALGS